MAHLIRLLPATLAAVLLLAGCSATPDSDAIPTAATTRTSTASPSSAPTSAAPITPTPPTLPEAATRNDDAGQLAFIQHWWDLYNYAYATADPGPLMAVSDPSERGNANRQKDIESRSRARQHIEGGQYHVVRTVRPPLDDLNMTAPTVTVARDAGALVNSDASREEFAAEKEKDFGMILFWEGDHWIMYGLGTI